MIKGTIQRIEDNVGVKTCSEFAAFDAANDNFAGDLPSRFNPSLAHCLS